jgi:hypothetical protein
MQRKLHPEWRHIARVWLIPARQVEAYNTSNAGWQRPTDWQGHYIT